MNVAVIDPADLKELIREVVREELAKLPSSGAREVMTLQQVGEFLDRHPKVVMQLVRERDLPAHFISEREPRFKRSEVLTWLDNLPAAAKATGTEG